MEISKQKLVKLSKPGVSYLCYISFNRKELIELYREKQNNIGQIIKQKLTRIDKDYKYIVDYLKVNKYLLG